MYGLSPDRPEIQGGQKRESGWHAALVHPSDALAPPGLSDQQLLLRAGAGWQHHLPAFFLCCAAVLSDAEAPAHVLGATTSFVSPAR